jgi:hypothetical protein
MFLPQCKILDYTPIETTGKITASYILIFKFLDGSIKDSQLNDSNNLHALNFLKSAILMCYFVPKCLNSATF